MQQLRLSVVKATLNVELNVDGNNLKKNYLGYKSFFRKGHNTSHTNSDASSHKTIIIYKHVIQSYRHGNDKLCDNLKLGQR